MALSIGVYRGMKIKVGSEMIRVADVQEDGRKVVLDVGTRQYTISENERVEIMPEVFVFCGVYDGIITKWTTDEGDTVVHSRLAFEAPRSIRINRMGHGRAA
jgi:AICAR transformylase/IMP cyclohydrolase PurH